MLEQLLGVSSAADCIGRDWVECHRGVKQAAGETGSHMPSEVIRKSTLLRHRSPVVKTPWPVLAGRLRLIAEEVAKVYPELVTRDETGEIDSVRYEELAPLLLNEVRRQQAELEAQACELREVREQLAQLSSIARPADAQRHSYVGVRGSERGVYFDNGV
jgi:hypothetical protein